MEVFIVIGLIILAIALFVTEKVPIDVTAIGVMTVLILVGIVTPEEGLSGFSNSATITILCLFILSQALEETGAIRLISNQLFKIIGHQEWKIVLVLSIVSGFFSAFINNTAVVIVFLPIAVRISQIRKISLSKILIPLSFASMAGGSMTLIGSSTNLLVNGIATTYGVEEFTMFEFAPIGFVFFIVMVVYLVLIGRKILPNRKSQTDLAKDYEVDKFFTQVKVTSKCGFLGKRVTKLFTEKGIDIVHVTRENVPKYNWRDIKLEINDELTLKLTLEEIAEIESKKEFKIIEQDEHLEDEVSSNDFLLFEAIIGPQSSLNRKKFGEVNFRRLFRGIPLAVKKQGNTIVENIYEETLRFGDSILFKADRDKIDSFRTKDFILLDDRFNVIDNKKLYTSVSIVLGVILLATFSVLPILTAALLGCLLLVISGCITMKEAYKSVDWKIIFLLAGMIPLGIAMEKTGVSNTFAEYATIGLQNVPISITIGTVFIITAVISAFMSNNATAILLAPIGIALATQLGINPKALLVTIILASNSSFLTPIGYQTNLLVFGPGNYKFTDYFKVGIGITILFIILSMVLIPYFFQ